MLSAIASFIWASGPIMNAIFTILFFILIRLWSRSSTKITKPITKLGEKVEAAGQEIAETAKAAEDIIEGFDVEDTAEAIRNTSTSQLDAQFFGELFVAGLASGCLVKYVW